MALTLVIRNGSLIDGTGAPARRADIGIAGDRIETVGDLAGAEAARVIDAAGCYVTPGFIDVHTHSDLSPFFNPAMESKVRQGVTTEIGGNCGTSPAPLVGPARDALAVRFRATGVEPSWTTLDEYYAAVEAARPAQNFLTLIGHGTLRHCTTAGANNRPPDEDELRQMQRLLADALDQGAPGMSTGLFYPPGCYSETEEVIALARIAGERGKVYASHMRNESDRLLDSIDETVRIGREGAVSVQISHHKASGRPNWGKIDESLPRIDDARAAGVDVHCDVYPYTASSTGLSMSLPRWLHEGGNPQLLARLRDHSVRDRLREELADRAWDQLIGNCPAAPHYEGMRVVEIAQFEFKDPIDCVADLILMNEGSVSMISFGMSEDDVRAVLRYPHAMIGSDGSALSPSSRRGGGGNPHPRSYGTHPRVLGRYVREQAVLTWEDAVRKMTSLPAEKFGLHDRGVLRPGMAADIVVFRPDTVVDRATFSHPQTFPDGIEHVLVNGALTVEHGEPTEARAGRVVRL